VRAIQDTGKAVDANLRGFEAGLKGGISSANPAPARPRLRAVPVDRLIRPARDTFPPSAHDFIMEGVTRLADYQDVRYATLYLDRLERIYPLDGGDCTLTTETARFLALWMAYQDLIRVAQQKSHPDRFERIRAEVRAGPGEVVQVVEFFKPGIEEFCAVLPPFLAKPILAFARRRGSNFSIAMHVHSGTIWGFIQLILLARLRIIRPYSYRFKEENRRIEEWLADVHSAAAMGDRALALEIVRCAGVIKGYGDTFNRSLADFNHIVESLVKPALAGKLDRAHAADAVKEARLSVTGDPDGERPGSRDFNFIPLTEIH